MQAGTPPATEQPQPEIVFWTVKDVAQRLQMSDSKVYEMVMFGQIPSIKIGGLLRFRPRDIDAWAEEMARSGGIPVATRESVRAARRKMRREGKLK